MPLLCSGMNGCGLGVSPNTRNGIILKPRPLGGEIHSSVETGTDSSILDPRAFVETLAGRHSHNGKPEKGLGNES